MGVGKTIRELRKLKGITAKELATKAGVNPSSVSRMELEDRSPRADHLAAFAHVLEVSTDRLLGLGEIEMSPEVDVRRQSLKRFLRMSPQSDDTVKGLEELCYKDSGPKSTKEWEQFMENHNYMATRKP